jgi:hypothetical protein
MLHEVSDPVRVPLIPVLRLICLYGSLHCLLQQSLLAPSPLLKDLTHNTFGKSFLKGVGIWMRGGMSRGVCGLCLRCWLFCEGDQIYDLLGI